MNSVPPFAAQGETPTAPRAPGQIMREPLRADPQTGAVATPILDDPAAAAMFESLVLGGYSPEEALALLQAMIDGQMAVPFVPA